MRDSRDHSLEQRQIDTEAADISLALQKLARHRMIERLYQDILIDMAVCEIEGWDRMEYIRELQECVNRFTRKEA